MTYNRLHAVKSNASIAISYICDPQKTKPDSSFYETGHEDPSEPGPEDRVLVTGIKCNPEHASGQFGLTKQYFRKKGGITCIHGFQSFVSGTVTAETAHEIGVKTAERLGGDMSEVVVATHSNTDHCHNHFVINSVSFYDGRKWRGTYGNRDFYEESKRLCCEYGLPVIERADRRRHVDYMEHADQMAGRPTIRGMVRFDIDRAVKASVSSQDFIMTLGSMGYEFILLDEHGEKHPCPGLKAPGMSGYIRFDSLGKGYDPESIRKRIRQNRMIEDPFPLEEAQKARSYRKQERPKAKGLYGLYLKYCFELGVIKRYPASVKKASFYLMEDIIKLDRLDAQTLFIARHGIETKAELDAFMEEAERKYTALATRRFRLKRAQQYHKVAGRTEQEAETREERLQISAEMKDLRKDMKTCREIMERYKQIERNLEFIENTQAMPEKDKEEREDELHGRSGRPGSKDEPGRR